MTPKTLGDKSLAVLDTSLKVSLIKHPQNYDEKCLVCTHPLKAVIEALYKRWTRLETIEQESGIERDAIKLHMDRMGFRTKRASNVDDLAASLMELGFDNVDQKDIGPKELIALMKLKARLDGRIDGGNKGDRPTVVIIQGLPGRTELMAGKDAKVLEGRVIPVLGPGGKPRD